MNCVYDILLYNICVVLTMLSLTSCSINISQVHTDGQANDIIDNEEHQEPDLSIDTGAI